MVQVSKSQLGRAELLRGLALAGEYGRQGKLAVAGMAALAGYVNLVADEAEAANLPPPMPPPAQAPVVEMLTVSAAAESIAPASYVAASVGTAQPLLKARFWAVTKHEVQPPQPDSKPDIPNLMQALTLADLIGQPDARAPAWQAITPPAKLMPALKRNLPARRASGLNVAQLVATLVRAKPLRRLPRKLGKGWAERLLLVLDISQPLQPYHADMHQLAHQLRRWVGRAQVRVRVVANERHPLGAWQAWDLDGGPAERENGFGMGWGGIDGHVLLVSELGLLADDGGVTSRAWGAWLNRLRQQGALLQVWSPVPLGLAQPAGADLAALPVQALVPLAGEDEQEIASAPLASTPALPRVVVVHWSMASHLRAHPLPAAELHRTPERLQLAHALRTQLAVVARLEPGLLRALRVGADGSAGVGALDAGLEQLAWAHEHMTPHASARCLRTAFLPEYRQAFAGLGAALQCKVLDCILAQHKAQRPMLAYLETMAWAAYARREALNERQQVLKEAEAVLQRLAYQPFAVDGVGRNAMCDFIARFASDADETTRSQCRSPLSRLWVALQREIQHEDGQTIEGLAGLDVADMAAAWGEGRAAQAYWLGLDEENGYLSLMRSKPEASRLLLPQPMELHALSIAMAEHAPRCVLVEMQSEIALARLPWGDAVPLPDQEEAGLPPWADGQIALDTASEQLTIEEIEKPRWALGWGRDEGGLYVLMPNPWGEALRLAYPWPVALGWSQRFAKPSLRHKGGFDLDGLMLGIDEFGLFSSFTVNNAHTQVLRYIAPGCFIMGSPPSELDRFDDEGPQHEVMISQGFWLADTACTQGLWQTIMKKKPSRFKLSGEHPVEKVSWLDIQSFLQKLQAALPVGLVSLPTEAEWEYACRAGTMTPFSFGPNINTTQVNFNGNRPYADAEKGEYRGKTVAVKALAMNDWGLYQMHGNVWEWCADPWLENVCETLDPGLEYALAMAEGGAAESGLSRALRGGTWYNYARFARSARRLVYAPIVRGRGVGFRFVLRSGSQASAPGRRGFSTGGAGFSAGCGKTQGFVANRSASRE